MKDVRLSSLRELIGDIELKKAIVTFGMELNKAKEFSSVTQNDVCDNSVNGYENLASRFAEELYKDLAGYPVVDISNSNNPLWIKSQLRKKIISKFVKCEKSLELICNFVEKRNGDKCNGID